MAYWNWNLWMFRINEYDPDIDTKGKVETNIANYLPLPKKMTSLSRAYTTFFEACWACSIPIPTMKYMRFYTSPFFLVQRNTWSPSCDTPVSPLGYSNPYFPHFGSSQTPPDSSTNRSKASLKRSPTCVGLDGVRTFILEPRKIVDSEVF